MAGRRTPVNKVRASRDGHEYHEAWTARLALQLLWPDSKLAAIAVEGLSPIDQGTAKEETVDIADISLYYGSRPTFEDATHSSIVQFKYSIANKDKDFRASHAKETISKFAETYCDYKKRYGAQEVKNKLGFELITNQPIYVPLLKAIEALAKGLPTKSMIEKQAQQFRSAAGLDDKQLSEFAAMCKISGNFGSLQDTKSVLTGLIVDWSATGDPIAEARLGKLRQMVRDKAGQAGTDQNLIRRTDVLAVLEIGDSDDLLPCPTAIPDVGKIVEREQLAKALAIITELSKPLLIHAAGGIGKTVFMNSLAGIISAYDEVVFFDCFGGGAYRTPEDSRHHPKKGFIHIANTLAFKGLCDPILPGVTEVQKTFRRRLEQAVSTLKRYIKKRELVLFIDAIDNAELFAEERNEVSFPTILLESLHHKPIPGIKLIVSSRSERKPSTYACYEDFELLPFSINETKEYLIPRIKKISQAEINVAQARSGGNPRVLEYLVKSDRSLLEESELKKGVVLDDLIQQRITDALSTAVKRGYKQDNINAFLAGLAVLPPPVPLDEYADTHGMTLSAIESFAADLRPLLERTNQGLMFRDEPTETLIRNRYSSSPDALKRVAENLLARQNSSVYAARALPGLLHILDDSEQLFNLAFDDRIPARITSTVGKRNIRLARIKAAALNATEKLEYNRLVQLLLELSTIAAVDQRGENYILDYPDLVVAAQDVDATRRLFEARTGWPGTRHSRLVIANCLSGDTEEASRHAIKTKEWIDHYLRTDRENTINRIHPERIDIAAIPFFLICEGRPERAIRFLKWWRDWYAYDVCKYVFEYCKLATALQLLSPKKMANFVNALTDIGPLTAALSFLKFPKPKRKELLVKLSKVCRRATKLYLPETFDRDYTYRLHDGLRKTSAMALSMDLTGEALDISLRAPHNRPGLWSMRDIYYHTDVFPFIFRTALVAAAKKSSLHEKDLLTKELVSICSRIKRDLTAERFNDRVLNRIPKYISKDNDEYGRKKDPNKLSYEEKEEAKRFIGQRLEPLLNLTKALAAVLVESPQQVDRAFIKLLKVWEDARKSRDLYETKNYSNFFCKLGLETAVFALWTRSELKPSSIKRFLKTAHDQDISVDAVIQIVSILVQRESIQSLAGEQALLARTLIETENDVTQRASLFAKLGQAILPASIDDASVYFREGLEQMDAIGSGDDMFTNGLLNFASELKGDELNERDFHTLTNICELNIGEEPEKFFWISFARGLSKTAGPRGLVKLSRWDDRSRVRLKNTLLPYLVALMEDGKIDSEFALVLNRLAGPVEYHECGTKEFAKAIESKGETSRPEIISELINQFLDNNPGTTMNTTVKELATLAEKSFDGLSETTAYLSAAHKHIAQVRKIAIDQSNYISKQDTVLHKGAKNTDQNNKDKFRAIISVTDPRDQNSIANAIKELHNLQRFRDSINEFFALLRSKVMFGDRAKYISNLTSLEHFDLHWKLAELKECKKIWGDSSAVLSQVFKREAIPLTQLHADDLVNDGHFSGYMLKEISDLTGTHITELVLELIKVLVQADRSVAGAVWLSFATFICQDVDEGQGQIALSRLLNSRTAKLADSVIDGIWVDGLYPENNMETIAAGLIWRMLGSPDAEDRWRAAHSVRCLAKFGRWDTIDDLLSKLSEKSAGPFQASELTFYYLHARLWLLIALARIALDYPEQISRFKAELLTFVTDDDNPHVLMRHFAARSLLTCVDSGHLKIKANIIEQLRRVNLSPYPRLKEKIRCGYGGIFYHQRPESAPKPSHDIVLDFDFHKNEVERLSQVFGKQCWEVKDMLSDIIHHLDPKVTSMYETEGRVSEYKHVSSGMGTYYHSYGQHLGWHAQFLVAGKLLNNYPVTNDLYYYDEPWDEWLRPNLLTRDDGFWLSDGTDRTPLDTIQVLREESQDGLALTGDKEKLLQLAGLKSRITKEVVVQGFWHSYDNIEVHITSALVPTEKATRLARKLTREEPIRAWVPTYHGIEDDYEYGAGDQKGFTPWILDPSGEAQLDKHDPFGVSYANTRPRLSQDYISTLSLTSNEPFGRNWQNQNGTIVLRAQAWGREDWYGERGINSGYRLLCSASSLKRILKRHDKNLLLLIVLKQYEKGYGIESKFTHTVAVVGINKELNLEYYKGRINYLLKPRY